MTSLQETLPILDQAVPALPEKVEAAAREAGAFEKVAREAIASFQARRAGADGLMEQVRHALETFRDAASQHRASVDEAASNVRATAEEEASGLEQVADAVREAAAGAASALDSLRSTLDQGAARTKVAHDEGRAAVDALDGHTRRLETELMHAVARVTTAIGAVRSAVEEGQGLVADGVGAVARVVTQLADRIQSRIERNLGRIEALGNEQEREMAAIVEQVENGRQRIQDDIGAGLSGMLAEGLTPELEAVAAGCAEVDAEVQPLDSELAARCQELKPELQAIADLQEPMQDAVAQVRQAAEKVGLAWP